MPITRMDIMTMAPKSQEATSFKVAEQQKPVNEQMFISNLQQKELMHNSMQTVKATEADNHEFRYDAKEKGRNKYTGKQKKKSTRNGAEEEKKDREDFVKPFHIDITI